MMSNEIECSTDNYSGFEWIVFVHRIYGLSYNGYKIKFKWFKALLYLWNSLVILIYGFLLAIVFIKGPNKEHKNKSSLVYVLYCSAHVGYVFEICLINLIIMFKGNKILESIQMKIVT